MSLSGLRLGPAVRKVVDTSLSVGLLIDLRPKILLLELIDYIKSLLVAV